jgi:sarcosine oxidase delta subunit
MTGLATGDISKINENITRQNDVIDFKYVDDRMLPRQWIMVMDGNGYAGVQRNPNGNRRFYPIFVGQLPNENDKRKWDEKFRLKDEKKAALPDEIWKYMAECRAWMEANGMDGYNKFVDEVVNEVQAFNDEERRRDRGTSPDFELENYFYDALLACPKSPYRERGKDNNRAGTMVYMKQFNDTYKTLAGNNRNPNSDHLKTKMTAAGGEPGRYTKNQSGFFFAQYPNPEEMNDKLREVNSEKGEEGAVVRNEIEVPKDRDGF